MNTITVTNDTNNGNAYNNHEVVSTITRKEFCIIWKKVFNDKRTKPSLVEYKSYGGGTYKVKEKGWIYPEHHIIHNLIRDLPASRGFKEGTEGYENALNFLKKTSNFGYASYVLKPFEEHIPAEKFKALLLEIQNLLK